MLSPDSLLAHGPFVRSLAQRLAGDPNEADDIAQETWIQVLERPPSHARNPRAWFASVVRSRMLNRHRGRASRTWHESSARKDERVPSTLELLAESGVRSHLRDALDGLEPIYREVIELRFFEDMPPREIARELDLPVETVRTRSKRALSILRARLDAEHGGDRQAWCIALSTLAAPQGSVVSVGSFASGALYVGASLLALLGVGWFFTGETPEIQAPGEAVAKVEVDARTSEVSRIPPARDRGLPAPTPTPGESAVAATTIPRPSAPPPGPTRGELTLVDGEPVAGATVLASSADAPYDLREVAVTDAAGRFEISGLDADSWIGARLDHLRTHLLYLGGSERRRAERYSLEFRKHHSSALELLVVDTDDRPIAGAEVSIAYRPEGTGHFDIDGKLTLAPASLKFLTDEAGELVLEELQARNYTLRVGAPGYASVEQQVETVTPDPLRFELSPASTESSMRPVSDSLTRIRGTLESQAGAPLAGWRVACARSVPAPTDLIEFLTRRAERRSTTSDRAGHFELPAGAGEYDVFAWAPDSPSVAPDLWRVGVTIETELVLVPGEFGAAGAAGAILDGVLEDSSGAIVDDATIFLTSASFDQPLRIEVEAGTGRFHIGPIPACSVSLATWTPGSMPMPAVRELDLLPGQELRLEPLTVPDLGSLRVRLRDTAGELPPRATVTLKRAGFTVKMVDWRASKGIPISAAGDFEVAVPPGVYHLETFCHGFVRHQWEVEVRGGVELDRELTLYREGEVAGFELQLPPGRITGDLITVHVSDPWGKGVQAAQHRVPVGARTSPFYLEPLGRGKYQVQFEFELAGHAYSATGAYEVGIDGQVFPVLTPLSFARID